MRVGRLLLGCMLFAGVATACVSRGARAPAMGGHDVITLRELEAVTDMTLYDAVRRLRPHMLRSRAKTAEGRPATRALTLYVDGERMDSIDDLRRVSPRDVQEVRFLEPHIANTRYASYNNSGGAISVTLKP